MGKRGPKKGKGGRPRKPDSEVNLERRSQKNRTHSRREVLRYMIRAFSQSLKLYNLFTDRVYEEEPERQNSEFALDMASWIFDIMDDVHSKHLDKIKNVYDVTVELLWRLTYAGTDHPYGKHIPEQYQLPEKLRLKVNAQINAVHGMLERLPEYEKKELKHFDGAMWDLPLDDFTEGELTEDE